MNFRSLSLPPRESQYRYEISYRQTGYIHVEAFDATPNGDKSPTLTMRIRKPVGMDFSEWYLRTMREVDALREATELLLRPLDF